MPDETEAPIAAPSVVPDGHDDAGHALDRDIAAMGRQNRRRLWRVFALTAAYLVVEIIGGLLTNSLALLSGAGHMLTDVASLGLALLAAWFATRAATAEKTFGYHRLEILAAFVNGLSLLLVSLVIIVEAVARIHQPREVMGAGLLVVAVGGLIVNLLGAFWLRQGHQPSLNMQAAFYHMAGDLLGSIGAVLAGLLILLFHWYLADPILAIVTACLIAVSAIVIVRDAVDVLLEATPAHLDTAEIRGVLLATPGVENVHNLHVWSITSGLYAVSCHCVVAEEALTAETLQTVSRVLHDRFGLVHHTVQLETCGTEWCPLGHG
ncbi:MAG: cation diffusion facilitator family transporter [Armatimonadia bacterium]